ncbi:putative NLI interacting factor like phosphatase [Trypanosoma vivax]|uniref:Mitochondrial import inner membrane translocase subunit TIM50 n=1 Tax=Trypanosoma vivax (strain Y486) TaxID=1055687 RepID=G0U269_TRYVY|nr:hypothetical protein TRVL_07221 [Trypanosoma vivax]KAH8611676.1 putative NLI interacting factor like phosphatase [Trypanosoma vivax]CCC50372.1 conserved hypothetical protein [Trypanosoma vivax Y486]
MLSGSRVPIFVILDIDGTLLSRIRCSTAVPFLPLPTLSSSQMPAGDASLFTLRYCDVLRHGWTIQEQAVVTRPYLREFINRLNEISTTRTVVRLGIFTRNELSYARAVADQLLTPMLHSGSLAFVLDGTQCVSQSDAEEEDENRGCQYRKPLAVSGAPNTSLLIDDSCRSFVPKEFFSGRGILVPSFFSGGRVWKMEDELCSILECAEQETANSTRFADSGECFTPLYAVIREFVAFWHDHHTLAECDRNGLRAFNLLTDTRARRYADCWHAYHLPLEDRLRCIALESVAGDSVHC